MNTGPFISVVISFRNEAQVLPELIRRLENSLESLKANYELIFVNDASTDNSRDLLIDRMKTDRHIKLINMSRCFGVSPCVMAGLSYSSGDAVIYMDADLQDPPELIPEMIKTWAKENVDVVHTRRLSRAGESRIKLWITRLGYLILSRISSVNIEPEVGDYKLLSKRAVKELIRLKEKKPFMRGMVNWIGFKQATIGYHREPRFAGKAKFPILGLGVINNFLDSALISFSEVPLKIALFLGFLVSFGAFCYLVVIFVMKFLGLALPGWAAIMATVLMLGGVQLFTIGFLGLYVNSIFVETKDRPNYIIESTQGFEP